MKLGIKAARQPTSRVHRVTQSADDAADAERAEERFCCGGAGLALVGSQWAACPPDVTALNKGRSIMKRYHLIAAAAFMALAIPTAYAAETAAPEQMQQRFQQMQTMMDQAQQAKTLGLAQDWG